MKQLIILLLVSSSAFSQNCPAGKTYIPAQSSPRVSISVGRCMDDSIAVKFNKLASGEQQINAKITSLDDLPNYPIPAWNNLEKGEYEGGSANLGQVIYYMWGREMVAVATRNGLIWTWDSQKAEAAIRYALEKKINDLNERQVKSPLSQAERNMLNAAKTALPLVGKSGFNTAFKVYIQNRMIF